MTSLVERVRQHVDPACLTTKCKKGNCTVKLDGVPRTRAVVDLDCMPGLRHRTRCDYMLVTEGALAWIVPIELKGGRVDGRHAVQQLQGGVDALPLSVWQSDPGAWELVPVIAHGKRIHREERRKLRRLRVKLGDVGERAVTIRCGRPLAEKLR